MAILKRKIFLPDDELLRFFARLGACKICSPLQDSEWADMLVLETYDGHRVVLSGDYRDVEFKFEVFYISSRSEFSSHEWLLQDVISFPKDVRAEFLFQTAWLRSANKGELPPQYEQIIEERGNRKLMPVTASAAGLYLKGIAFSLSNTEPLAIIMVDDDIPLSLIILTSKKDIDEIISKCECIQPSKLDEWVMDLSQEWTQPAETS